MTDPIDGTPQQPRSWKLILDEGDDLEVRAADRPDDPLGPHPVAVFMSADRAADVSEVLGAYTRIAEIMQEAGQVSSTEASLQHGLRQAALAAKDLDNPTATGTRIGHGARLKAMEILQAARTDLSHTALMAITDSAARWLTDNRDDTAIDLLTAVTEDAGMNVYLALLGRPAPPPLIAGARTPG